MKHAHKLVPIFLVTALLALSACGSDAQSPGDKDHGHDHAEDSSHESYGAQESAPETKAYYGDDESPTAVAAEATPSDHAHDGDHGHSH